jgi:NAD-dependent DNA ligase (contains BRCT domain type II)
MADWFRLLPVEMVKWGKILHTISRHF